MTLTKPQLARWRSRINHAWEQIEGAIFTIESALEVNPVQRATVGETKDEECEHLAAECATEALGCLHGAVSRLAASGDHLDWERAKAVREFPMKVHRFIQANRGGLPPELVALADACKGRRT